MKKWKIFFILFFLGVFVIGSFAFYKRFIVNKNNSIEVVEDLSVSIKDSITDLVDECEGSWNIIENIKNKFLNLFYSNNEFYLNIFVHGNFNTGLGMLSLSKVLKDDVKGSEYIKMVRRLRKDPFFYQEQPILARGLIEIEPTFILKESSEGFKFAAYPIIASYKQIYDFEKGSKKEINRYYTFGWSGILSQSKRIQEAVRFYNIICEELEKYKKKGIDAKVRIIAHSHGGNVSMNLGLVHDAMRMLKDKNFKISGFDLNINKEMKEYFEQAIKYIQSLPFKRDAKKQNGLRQYDYLPNKELKVEELTILGSPIQAENSFFINSDLFKRSFSIYSEQDIVQFMDIFTSKQFSGQRLSFKSDEHFKQKVVQVKIMIDRDMDELKKPPKKDEWWGKVAFDRVFAKESKDPTHKDLWFLAWNKEFGQPNFPLKPIPLVVLLPCIVKILEKNPTYLDVDLNIVFEKDQIRFLLLEHDKAEKIDEIILPASLIQDIKNKVLPWKPDELYKHSSYKRLHTSLH